MKMTAVQPAQGTFDFDRADAIVDWARAAGKKVHGHVLVWCADEWNPSWVTHGDWTRDELLAVMEDHIRTVMGHFEGRVETWDVVNEAVDPAGARRDCVWQRVIGDDWVAQAFRIAREADPSAKLFYNEYGADVPGPQFDAVAELVRGIAEVDGVGLQHHTYGYAAPQYQTEDLIARLGALGLDVHISELNVTTSQLGGDLARQAQAYWTIAAACQAQPACFRITTWGFTDAYGWRPPAEQAMPFDAEYRPKPAWHAIQRAVGRESGPQPPAPGPPAAVLGSVSWPAVEGATYTLQHRDANDAWRTIATGIPATSLPVFEPEGTWDYRVRAEDGPWSEPSTPLVVDRTPPLAPTVPQQWFRDTAVVSLVATDPSLPDGSPGSGVEPAPAQTFTATGPLFGTVRDRAGNVSPEGGGVVRVDTTLPTVTLSCPREVVRGGGALGRWTASDEGSGLATPAAGAVPFRTAPPGRSARRASTTARDLVGHSATATCTYRVLSPLRLWTTSAPLHRGAVRLRVGCRSEAPRACEAILALRRLGRRRSGDDRRSRSGGGGEVAGRPRRRGGSLRRGALMGRSRAVTIPRGATRTVRVPLRTPGSFDVFAGRDRLGAVQTRRSSIQRVPARTRSAG